MNRLPKFLNTLELEKIEIDENDIQLYRYNPPFTLPFLRTNEIAVRCTNGKKFDNQNEEEEKN